MIANSKMNKPYSLTISLVGVVAFFLAVAPILDPYIIAEMGSSLTIRVNDLFIIILGVVCFCKNIKFEKRSGLLLMLPIGLLLVSVFSLLGSDGNMANILKNVIIWSIYAFLLMYIWKTPCRDDFFRYVGIIGTVAATVVIMQFICGNLSLPMWNGRLPILELSKYDQWAGYVDFNTGDIRPNGIFQEASYVGIYLLVPYVQSLKENKIRKAIFFAVAMVLTTSLVSVFGTMIATGYMVIDHRKLKINKKIVFRIILAVIIVIIAGIILINSNDAVKSVWRYVLRRLNNLDSDISGIRESSSKIRLLGNIDLYEQFSLWQKTFGVGVSQYSTLFQATSYSNVYVTTLLNSGVAGIVLLFFFLYKLRKNVCRENVVFCVLLMIIFAVDYMWFNWYFFYYISACLLVSRKQEQGDADIYTANRRM